VKASDITDEAFLGAVTEALRLRSELEGVPPRAASMATRWDVAAVLAGHPERVGGWPVNYARMPEEVVMAKAQYLIDRGLLDGCTCGCRGEFEVITDGR
jgi:hypothetical protein